MRDRQRKWNPVLCCAALAAAMLAPHPASAQSYPNKAVRLVVPFAAGGNTDIIARFYTPKMAEFLGQQIIIDNRGGAGYAADTLAESPFAGSGVGAPVI